MEVAILPMATGALVSNTYATCPGLGDNPRKRGLIPRMQFGRMAWL